MDPVEGCWGPGAPFVLEQTEAWRTTKKSFLRPGPPYYLRVWMTNPVPPPLIPKSGSWPALHWQSRPALEGFNIILLSIQGITLLSSSQQFAPTGWFLESGHFSSCSWYTNQSQNFTNLVFVTSSLLSSIMLMFLARGLFSSFSFWICQPIP